MKSMSVRDFRHGDDTVCIFVSPNYDNILQPIYADKATCIPSWHLFDV